MDRLQALRVFVRVAELGSFTRAAASLELHKAAASLAVQQLEHSLGTALFHRTTRRVELTPDGRSCYERSKALLSDADELQSMFRQSPLALRGRLRVDMPTRLARNYILPRLPEFTREHPELQLEVSATDRRVDLVREAFDCVVRVGPVEDLDLIARSLGALRVMTCASPDYLAARGTPRTLADLAQHHLVHFVATLGGKPDGWEYFDGTRYRVVPMDGAITVNSADAYEAACVAGYGLIQAPAVGLAQLIEQGVLVEVLPEWRAEPMPVSLLHAHRRNVPQRVRRFMDWVATVLAPYLEAR